METLSRNLEKHVRALTDDIGIRLAGSQQEYEAALYIEKQFRQYSDSVVIEKFPVMERCVEEEKLEIRDRLVAYCDQKGSQNKGANSLNGVSPATVSKIINGEWELINEVMWRSIAAQIGMKNKNWNIVETRDFKALAAMLADAQENAMVRAVCGDAGSGKTLTIRHYSESNPNVFVLSCNEYWNRKLFLQELLREMGCNPNGDTVGEMMASIVGRLKKMENPIIIMDEADKLGDQVMYFFITLFNNIFHSKY